MSLLHRLHNEDGLGHEVRERSDEACVMGHGLDVEDFDGVVFGEDKFDGRGGDGVEFREEEREVAGAGGETGERFGVDSSGGAAFSRVGGGGVGSEEECCHVHCLFDEFGAPAGTA